MNVSGGSIVWVLDADTGEFSKALLSAEDQARKTGRAVEDSLSKGSRASVTALGDLGRSVGRVGWNVFTTGAGLASIALTGLITKGIQTADYMETTRIAMSGLTGSVEEGNKALLIAKNFWENSPFNRIDVVPAVKSLIQFGRTTQQVGADLELLGNVSLSTSTPIQELALYFARTAGAGRAMTQDLEIMAQRGVPIYKKLQEAISSSDSVFATQIRNQYDLAKGAEVSSGAVREMASDGAISFGIFEEAMRNAVDPKAMEEFEKTLARQIDKFRGAISILAGEMGGYEITATELIVKQDGLTRSATRLTAAFATGLSTPEMRESINKLGKALVPFVDKITELVPMLLGGLSKGLEVVSNNTGLLVPILGGALVMFGQLGQGIPGVGQVLANLSGSFDGLGKSIWKLVKVNPLLAAFIGFFAVGLVQAYRTNADFRDSVKRLFDVLGQLGKKLVPIMTKLVTSFTDLAGSGGAVKLLTLVVDILVKFVDVLLKLPDDVLSALIVGILAFKTMSPALKVIGDASSVFGIFSGILGKFKTGGAEAGGKAVGSAIAGILKPLGNNEVLKGAASAALIGVALITISIGLSKASSVNINIKNLTSVVVAIGIFAGLSALLGKITGQVLPGLVTVIAIAGTLALVGMAIKSASSNIPSNIGEFAKKMGTVGVAIGAMAAISGIIGALVSTGVGAAILAAGLLAMVGISLALIVIANSIKEVNSKVPANTSEFMEKVNLIADTVKAVAKINLGSILNNLGTAINVSIIALTVKKYVDIAEYLKEISRIEIYKESIISKIELIKEVLEIVGGTNNDSIGQKISNIASNFLKLIDTEMIGKVVKTYFDIATQLTEIQNLSLNREAITRNLTLLSDIVASVSYTGSGSIIDTMRQAANQFFDGKATESAAKVVGVYAGIIGSVKEIEKLDIKPDKIVSKIGDLTKVVKAIMGVDGGGGLFQTMGSWFKGSSIDEKDVNKVQSILNKFTEISQTVNGMVSVGSNSVTKVEELNKVILTIGSVKEVVNIDNKEHIIQMSQSIVNRMTGIAKTINDMVSLGGNSLGKIESIREAIYQLGLINQTSDIGNKEYVIQMSQSILNRMTGIAQTINDMVSLGGNSITKIESIRGAIYQIGLINQSSDISNKEYVVGVSQSILNKMTGVAQTLNGMVSLGGNSIEKIITIRGAIYQLGLIYQASDIGNKEYIVAMSQSILNKMTGVAQTINAMAVVISDKVVNIRVLRNAIYEITRINQDVGDLANKQAIVARANAILIDMAKFATTLSTLPAVKDSSGLINALVSNINAMMQAMVGSLASRAAEMTPVGASFGNNLANGIRSTGPIVSAAGLSLQSAMWQAIQARMSDEYYQGAALANKLAEGIRSGGADAGVAGGSLQSAMWRAIQSKMSDEYHQGIALANSFSNGLMAGSGGAYNSGVNAVNGFINGVKSRNTYSVGYNMANDFLNGLKKRANENSPWKTTMQSGSYAAEGLAIGIKKSEGLAIRAATSLADGVVTAMEASPTISPQMGLATYDSNIPNARDTGVYGNNRSQTPVINQTNNVYTELDMQQVNRDLAWDLAKA